ncbi:hypothetical protein ABL78_8155 [Leptomonas seymouri]|uniref:Uncharacterized protein n=1 Tax=Leptomonas seymouri TaxID=5684 RepID=A0A0N1PA23_LEPSE|nr:hypothetical protein ABL78_8155 [Leptomonas seymouri]|eukprot:KPI82835.1 hypothetical protein ABL78_8155 [Leptomonas seymouri]
MSMQKLTFVTAALACTPTIFALAQGESAAPTSDSATMNPPSAVPVPVNLSQNIVTIVLILGVSIAVSLIFVLSKLIPKLRRGELSFSKIEFDWRAELLNQTPTKEKVRRAEETARRNEERARRNEERAAGHYADVDERGMRNQSAVQPRIEMRETDEPVAVACGSREPREDDDALVKPPREHRE